MADLLHSGWKMELQELCRLVERNFFWFWLVGFQEGKFAGSFLTPWGCVCHLFLASGDNCSSSKLTAVSCTSALKGGISQLL
jgi:hypothetical protein